MAERVATPQVKEEVREHRHEQTDVSLKGVIIFLLIMVTIAVLMHVSLWWWLQGMSAASAKLDQATTWRPASRPVPLERVFPKLQVIPKRDLQSYLAEQRRQLSTYGWINHTGAVVRIPISRAMELVAQRGLPQWGPTNQASISPLELQRQRANQDNIPNRDAR